MTIRNRVQYRVKRLLVRWKQWQDSLNDTINVEKIKLGPFEEKAIKLWKLYLKDKESSLAYNTLGVRQIEKENVFIILQASGNLYHIMTIMDVNDTGKNLFEVHIPTKEASEIVDSFDTELEKRMKKVENNKRSIIESDLDKLLKLEQSSLKK